LRKLAFSRGEERVTRFAGTRANGLAKTGVFARIKRVTRFAGTRAGEAAALFQILAGPSA
jgi:hypothetical protein